MGGFPAGRSTRRVARRELMRLAPEAPAKEVEMPLQDHMKLISVDDHVIEHPNVWQDRLPERYRDAGPRIVEVDDDFALDATGKPIRRGSQLWCYEGKLHNRIALD